MQSNELKDTAIYIHIPFCDHKCIYCDFYSIITYENIAPFLSAIKKEIKFYSKKFSSNRIISSVFFGGGTPSFMSPDYLGEIFSEIKLNFNVSAEAEITMETNPGTVDYSKLVKFKDAGINRISIGVQSFNDSDLRFMTRIHDRKTAIATVLNAEKAGYKNISLDLIFNLPGQKIETWINNLETAVSLPVQHISAYSLILEKGTILNKLVLDGKVKLEDDVHDAGLYETTIDCLTSSGFFQYEVSNFAMPGFKCVHNNAYWQYKDYIGFGTSSHSFADGKRWWNYSSLNKYISEIHNNNNAVANSENLSAEEMHNEFVMLALRSSGLDVERYKYLFGNSWLNKNYSYFEQLRNKNLILPGKDIIKLSGKGYAVCDEILKNIL